MGASQPDAQRHWRAYFPLLLFILALLPRLAALGRYVTPDELIWVYRSMLFREALLAGNWAETLVAGHPGVLTTWLGATGISLQLILRPVDYDTYRWITQLAYLTPDNMAAFKNLAHFLSAGRILVALVTSVGVVGVYWLARPLLGAAVAVLAAFLLALDPFVVGLSGLLHVDALVTTFATLGLLALLLAVTGRGAAAKRDNVVWLLIFSGWMSAWAVLTKSPAILLLPVCASVLFSPLILERNKSFGQRLKLVVVRGLLWSAAFLLATAVTFPAAWAAPLDVLNTMRGNAGRHIEEALRPTFFMGNVAFDHGPLFYPFALTWRLGPIVFLGGFLWVGTWLRRRNWRLQKRWPELVLFFWSLLFLLAISFAAKKFDRYALLVIPALTLLAAAAWDFWLQARSKRRDLWLALLIGAQFVYLLFFVSYPLAAYNPVVGGPITAVSVMPLGWGEGISAAGRWLADAPQADATAAISTVAPSLAPFFPGETLLGETNRLEEADYIILTAGSYQTGSDAVETAVADFELLHTLRYGGLDQAWIYVNPQPQPQDIPLNLLSSPLSFDNQVALLATGLKQDGDAIIFSAKWSLQQENGRYAVKISLRDAEGNVWAERETDLLNEVYFYPQNWRPGEEPEIDYRLDLSAVAPPGEYSVEVSLTADGAQLPVLAADGTFRGVTVPAELVEIPERSSWPNAAAVPVDVRAGVDWAGGDLRLIGHAELPKQIAAGSFVPLDLVWQAQNVLPAALQLAVQLGAGEPLIMPLSPHDTARWQPGEIVQTKLRIPISPELPPGEHPLQLWPVLENGTPLAGAPYQPGNIRVTAFDRLYLLPVDIQVALDVNFAPGVYLRGMDGETAVLNPGDTFPLTLYWQTEVQPQELLSAFVHVVAPDGAILTQADRWPGGIPSDIWAPGQVLIDDYTFTLPEDAPPGVYHVAVGLYTPANGLRLPASAAQGQPLPDDQFFLPLSLTIEAFNE